MHQHHRLANQCMCLFECSLQSEGTTQSFEGALFIGDMHYRRIKGTYRAAQNSLNSTTLAIITEIQPESSAGLQSVPNVYSLSILDFQRK